MQIKGIMKRSLLIRFLETLHLNVIFGLCIPLWNPGMITLHHFRPQAWGSQQHWDKLKLPSSWGCAFASGSLLLEAGSRKGGLTTSRKGGSAVSMPLCTSTTSWPSWAFFKGCADALGWVMSRKWMLCPTSETCVDRTIFLTVFMLCCGCFGLLGQLWELVPTTLTRSGCVDCHPKHSVGQSSKCSAHLLELFTQNIPGDQMEREGEDKTLAPGQLNDPCTIHRPLSPEQTQEKEMQRDVKPCLCYRALLLTGCAN